MEEEKEEVRELARRKKALSVMTRSLQNGGWFGVWSGSYKQLFSSIESRDSMQGVMDWPLHYRIDIASEVIGDAKGLLPTNDPQLCWTSIK